MRNKELLFGTILTYAQQIANVLIGLLYTPFLLTMLGQSEYGLYSTVTATISMMSLLNLGLSHGYIRYYVKYKKDGNQESINKLNGLNLLIFAVLGVVVFVVGFVISNNLPWIFKDGLTESEYIIAKRLAIVLTVSMAFSFPTSVFTSIITAKEKFITQKAIALARTVAAPLFTIPLLLFGYKSFALVIVSFAISTIADVALILYSVIFLKEKFEFSNFEKGLLKGIILYVFPIALNIIADQVNLNVDKLLLGRFKGTDEVAVYNVGFLIYALYVMLSTAISSVFTPRVHTIVNNCSSDNDKLKTELTSLFTKVGRMQCEVLLLFLTGLTFFGKVFITEFWAGAEYEESYYVFLLLAIPSTIHLIQNLGNEIQRAENVHRFSSYLYTAMAVINLVISVFLCQKYGAIGSAVGTAISFLLCNGIIMNIFYQKKCYVDIISFWKSISRIIVGAVPPVVIWIILRPLFDISNLWVFAGCVIGYTAVYCASAWLIGLNDEEKGLIKDFVRSIFKSH